MTEFPGWLAFGQPEEGLRDLDVAFGRLLIRQAPRAPELALRLAVLCSARLAHGHPCLDLKVLCEPGGSIPGGAGSGASLSRISSSTSAPSARL